MPPRKAPPKQSELLEKEAKEMESIMAMLRSQIDEERAKVQPKGTRWAAAAEGPAGHFDPYGPLARKILAKKKPQAGQTAPDSPTQASPQKKSPRPQKTAEPSKSDSSTEPIESPKTRKIEVVVEPQGGKLWGNYCDSECQPDDPPKGGSLWGPPPDEAAESAKFREEVAKLRGEKTTVSSGSGPSTTTTVDTQDEDLPPIGAGGALWGPPPNEVEEQMKFQRIVAKMRGEEVPAAPADQVASETSANLVERKKTEPTAFTYFDMLMNKDVLDGSRVVDKNIMTHEKRKDIFDVFASLEQMLEQQQTSQISSPAPQPEKTPPPKTRKPHPQLQFHSIREFASPHMVRVSQSKKSRPKSRKSPKRRRTPAELHTVQMFFLKWMQRCAEHMLQPESRTPRVSFALGSRRTTDDDPVTQFNLDETSPLPGTITGEAISSSEIVEETSFDIHDTPEPSPRGETSVTEFTTSSLKK